MSFANQYRSSLLAALDAVDTAKVQTAIQWLTEARDAGRQVFVCGNGGSASTASHFACDMIKGASLGRPKRFRIISLADFVPTILAYANDISYDTVFVEPLKNLANKGDVVIGISGSGNSKNVLNALQYAKDLGCRIITLSGRDGGKMAPLADLDIRAAEQHMGRIEDVHLIVTHMICYHFMDAEK